MRLALIGKYPPIQGGVSRSTYWMAHALAENGIDVHVVTNAQEVEPEYRVFDLGAWEPDLKLGPEPQPRSGCVQVHTTTSDPDESYIPRAKPFATKLAGLAADVVSKHDCSLIHAYYWEPYGLAAYLASTWSGVPFGLQHAGSDVGRLFSTDQLNRSYRRLLPEADYQILSTQTSELSQKLRIDPSQLYPLAALLPPIEYFAPDAKQLDIPLALRAVRDYFVTQSPLGHDYADFAEHAFDPEAPTVGVYGKLGRGKGHEKFISALGCLRKRGVQFNLVVLGQGSHLAVSDFISWLEAFGIRDRTFFLPFLPHWQVPHFIRACDVVGVLETGFPIAFHTPATALEIVACGTCLLMSEEIAGKQLFKERIVNGHNAYVVDPSDDTSLVETLHEILNDRRKTAAIGERGEKELALRDPAESLSTRVATQFLQIEREARERRALRQLATDITSLDSTAKLAGMDSPAIEEIRERLETEYRRARLPHLYDFIRSAFRVSCRLLEQEIRSRLEAYYLDPDVPHTYDTRSVLLDFASSLLEAIPSTKGIPDYTAEILCFEMQRFSLSGDPRALSRTNRASGLTTTCRLAPSRGLLLHNVKYDVPRLLERLAATNPDDPLPPADEFYVGSKWLVFKRIHRHEIEPETLCISDGMKAMLDACDGNSRPEEVVDRVLLKFPDESERCVCDALEKLWRSGCLEDSAIHYRLEKIPVVEQPVAADTGVADSEAWRCLGLCANAYPKRVVQILISRNVDRAHFNLREEAGAFVLRYKPLRADYGVGDILDELNYLCFAEKQREIAEPIRREIVSGLVRKFGGEG